jgi:hypothetical protein
MLLLERGLSPTRSGARKEKASNNRMDNIDNDIAVHLDLAKLSKLIKRVERGGENIVHGWDDKRNVA